MTLFEKYDLDKWQARFGTREELEQEDLEYWKNTAVEERLEALELLRQIHYGDYSLTDPIQRIARFVDFGKQAKE